MPSRKSLPPATARMLPTEVRIRQVDAASEARKTHFSHMSCMMCSLATAPILPLSNTFAIPRTRSDIEPSRSPKLSDCIGASWTTSRASLSVAAMAQRPPSTRSAPNFLSSTLRCSMPLSSGMMAVCGPTAGANDLIASSRSNALQLSSTTSNVSASLPACTVGGPLDDETGACKLGGALGPDQERHVVAGLQQPAAEIAADGAGADHENTHA